MATKPKKVSVRERSQTAPTDSNSVRAKKTAKKAWKPFQYVGQGLKIIFAPVGRLFKKINVGPIKFVTHILATVLFINYFRTSWVELRQVTWPDRKETAQLTFAVLMFAIVFGAIVSALDYGLDKIFHKILLS